MEASPLYRCKISIRFIRQNIIEYLAKVYSALYQMNEWGWQERIYNTPLKCLSCDCMEMYYRALKPFWRMKIKLSDDVINDLSYYVHRYLPTYTYVVDIIVINNKMDLSWYCRHLAALQLGSVRQMGNCATIERYGP